MSAESPFKSAQEEAPKALVNVTRTAGQLAAKDLGFFRASNPAGAKNLKRQNARLLGLAKRLITSATKGTATPVPQLKDADDVDDNWQGIVEVVDSLLEKADIALDEYTGVIKKLTPAQEEQAPAPSSRDRRRPAWNAALGMPKPQLQFNTIPTNDETSAWKPLLKSKPHSQVPLEKTKQQSITDTELEQYSHPYETEIQNYRYPASVYNVAEPVSYLPLESTKATFVDTPEAVKEMLSELKQATEIAIDLEHHDQHSYIGLVSLMQISTRNKDWVVDTLKPWREDLQILNEVFADPSILKVLHGAFMDIMWLQRDLGLYIVGLFDTYHASRSLRYPKASLASLLSKFANFDAQKKYQMADWRTRPIPPEMFDYARSDTHFLLYVYDNMRNELVTNSNPSQPEGNLVDAVLEESKKESLQRYERPIYNLEHGTGPNGWYSMLMRTPALFNPAQFSVFKAVHQWRDRLARTEDEALTFIMPKAALFNIAREMPTDPSALFGCASPVSSPVRRCVKDLVAVIKAAKAAGATGPDMNAVMKAHPLTVEHEAQKAQRLKDHAAANPTSVGQIIQRERANPTPHDVPTTSILTPESQFWGTTLNGHKRLRSSSHSPSSKIHSPPSSLSPYAATGTTSSLRLQVPLPHLTAEIFATGTDGAVAPAKPVPRPEHAFAKPQPPTFTIKELGPAGKKRKADSQPAPSDADADATEPPAAAADLADSKSARKARRRAERSRERAAQELAALRAREEVPFDYAAAPSVLDARAEKRKKAKKEGRGGAQEPFDPYQKSTDAPKGMRKAKKEIEGRSMTFRG